MIRKAANDGMMIKVTTYEVEKEGQGIADVVVPIAKRYLKILGLHGRALL